MSYSAPYLQEIITVNIDRPLWSKHPKHWYIYPINYWYVPNTKAPDWHEIDVYILWVFEPKQTFTWKCIAIIQRTDDDDDKLILVPEWKQYTAEQIIALTEFQEQYFTSNIIT